VTVFRFLYDQIEIEIRNTKNEWRHCRIPFFVLTSVNYGESTVMESCSNQKKLKNGQIKLP